MIDNLKINMAKMEKDIGFIKKGLDENKDEHKELRDLIKGFIAAAEKKYAPIWVSTAIKMVISAVFLSILGALLKLILL